MSLSGRVQRDSQYMTPAWAAERIVEIYFSDLCERDLVIEPTCGAGAFLAALPPHVPAFGVELDLGLATAAERSSGRPVHNTDIRSFRAPAGVTAVVGNPPFRAALVRDIIAMARSWLPHDGLCGLLLPTYLFQHARPTLELARDWRVEADHIPRDLFPGLTKPLVFATLRKGGRTLIGFSLYDETVDVAGLAEQFKETLQAPSPRPWRVVVHEALAMLGGQASLNELYSAVAPRRPSGNPWWKEKVRQVAQRHFVRVGRGMYSIPEATQGVAAT